MSASLYGRVINIISTSPEHRLDNDIHNLIPWFRKKSEIFKTLAEDVIIDLIRNCQFRVVERDCVLIQQGDTGDSFYIILRGSVTIYINNEISEAATEEDHLRGVQISPIKLQYDIHGKLDRQKLGNEIGHLESGRAFGELALINKNAIRNASIVVNTRTDLLVIQRTLFDRSLKADQTDHFEARKIFVQEHPVFSICSAKHRRLLAMSLNKEKIGYNESIVTQGDHTTNLHFLLKGQARVMVDADQHHTQFTQFFEKQPAAVEPGLIPHPLHSSHDEPENCLRRRYKRRKRIEIAEIGPNEIIGDVEFSLDLHTYMYTVVCTQSCELYTLNSRTYEHLMKHRSPRSVEKLRELTGHKLCARVERLRGNLRIPLLERLLERLEEISHAAHKLSTMKRNSIGSTENVHFNDELTVSQFAREVLPPRGPVVDLCGPGTLFERGKIHDIAKARRMSQVEYSGVKLSSVSPNRSELERSAFSRRRKSSEGSSGSEKNLRDISRKNIYVLEPERSINRPSEHAQGTDEVSDRDKNKLSLSEKENEKVSPRLQWQLNDRNASDSEDVGNRREFVKSSTESSDHDLSVLEARIQAWKQMYPVMETKRRQSVSNSVKLHRGKIHHTLPGITVVLRPKPIRITDMTSQFVERLHVKENPVDRRKSTMIERALNGRFGVELPAARQAERDSDSDSEQDEITVQVKEIVSKRPVALSFKERQAFKRQYTVEEYRTLKQHLRMSQKDLMRYGVFH